MFELMNEWALGYCLSCPDGEARHGKIQVLATLKKNGDGRYVVDRSDKERLEEIFGPGGKVFWPLWLAVPENLTGCIVRFRCEQGREYGTSDLSRDWMIVFQDRNGLGQVKRFEGFRLVDDNPDIRWREAPRWIQSEIPGDRLFLRDQPETRLIGPWRVGDEIRGRPGYRELCLDFVSPKVYKFPTDSFPPDSRFYHRAQTRGGESISEYLMYHPDPSFGKLVDLATPKQLASWLVGRIVNGASPDIERLVKEEPGWRKRVKEELENRIDDDRQIHLDRWNRLESILDDLTFDTEQTNQLLEHPRLKSIFEGAINAEVEAKTAARSAEIEAKAERRTEEATRTAKEAIDLQNKRVDEARKRVNEAIALDEARAAEAKARLKQLEVKLRERESEWAERERASRELKAHLNKDRERLARDIALYQSLSLNGRAADSKAAQTAPAMRPVRLEGELIESEADFIDKRLQPLIAERLHVHESTVARMLHAAISGTRMTLIPSPAWARAYVDALGGIGRLSLVNVAPTWLAFEDLWNGGFGPCWERATNDLSTIEIVLLRDFNRALPQCYARPLLDLIAGFADELPGLERGTWPPSLRVLACPASPEDSLPISTEVASHFAAIGEPPLEEGEAPPLVPGHVAADSWLGWREQDSVPRQPQKSLMRKFDFGPLVPLITRDLASLHQRLLAAGANENTAASVARDIRISEPREYANNSGSLAREAP